jgi:hypothetical protein
MRFFLVIFALAFSLNAAALAQSTSTAPFTLLSTPPQSSEVCRGVYVFIIKANGAPGNEVLYTIDTGSPSPNIRAAALLTDGNNLTVFNREEET